MSELHLGGDDLVDLADKIVDAVKFGLEIFTWYGPETEVVICGYDSSKIYIEKESV